MNRIIPSSLNKTSSGGISNEPSPASVAVLGCGYWGKNLVRNFGQLGSLTMVCDVTSDGQATAAQIAPQAHIVPEIQQVLVSDVDGGGDRHAG